jgi:hypothetical protein
MIAARDGQLELAVMLLDAGADANQQDAKVCSQLAGTARWCYFKSCLVTFTDCKDCPHHCLWDWSHQYRRRTSSTKGEAELAR